MKTGKCIIIALAVAVIGFTLTACSTDADTTTPAHVHDYEWTVTTSATCIATGEESGVCKLDTSHTTTREIAIDLVDGHDWGDCEVATAPTCTAKGIGSRVCLLNVEHAQEGAEIPEDPDAHDWNIAYTTISTATETIDGVEAIICKHNSTHTKEPRFNGEYATGTAGLAFELINNSTAYRVRKGSVNSGAVYIPAYRLNGDAYLPVTEIGSVSDIFYNGAFNSAENITAVHIPETVTTIGNSAFRLCSKLTSITIPASVTIIGTAIIEECTNLLSITVSENNPYYASEGGILYNKAKTELISYPEANGDVTIPTSVTTIGGNAFFNCTSITSIIISANVTSIDSQAFTACTSITSVIIPASVTSVGNSAFWNWTASQTINIAGHANRQSTISTGWSTTWDDNCNAVIKYWNGSSYL